MTVKKNPKLNLEKKKVVFFQIGLLFVSSIALVAFEWDSFEVKNLYSKNTQEIPEEIYTIDDHQEEKLKEEVFQSIPEPQNQQEEQVAISSFDMNADVIVDSQSDNNLLSVNIPLNVKSGHTIINTNRGVSKEEIITLRFAEKMPQFLHGDLQSYIAKHVEFPELAERLGVGGKVYIEFVVNSKGKVTNVKAVQSDDDLLNANSIEVIQNLPDFEPGSQKGRPVNVMFTVPINYVIY